MSIKLNGATNGSVELDVPDAIGSDLNITIPGAAGTLDRLERAGNILQVASATKTDTMSHNSSTFADIPDLSVSITPSSASNKVLIIAQLTGDGTANQARANFRLMRGSTPIGIGNAEGSRARATFAYFGSDTQTPGNFGGHFLDSPNTTSAVTYKVQVSNGNNTYSVYVNRASGWSNSFPHAATISSITVMEVAA